MSTPDVVERLRLWIAAALPTRRSAEGVVAEVEVVRVLDNPGAQLVETIALHPLQFFQNGEDDAAREC